MRTIQTSLGPVPLWGDFETFDDTRPLVFVIRGAFADVDDMTLLHKHLPVADVVLAHLPGMHSPFFSDCSVPAFAAAYDEVLAATWPDRRVVVLGLSVGGLVGLAMRRPARLVAVDPPISTASLWPLIPRLRVAAAADAETARWVREIFGVVADGVVNRDYGPLLDNPPLGVVLIAQEPLEPERECERLPGLLSAADRVRIAAAPRLQSVLVPGVGHNIPHQDPAAISWALGHALAQVSS